MFSPEKSLKAENSCSGSGFLARVYSRASMVRMLPPAVDTEPALLRPVHEAAVDEPDWKDLPPLMLTFWRVSQRAMESRVSWQRLCCLRTSQTGMKMVKISSIMMEMAILATVSTE